MTDNQEDDMNDQTPPPEGAGAVEASPPTLKPKMDLGPFRDAVDDLVNRHGDAIAKQFQYENEAHDLRMKLRRTEEAASYQAKRARGLERRIITGRMAVRAWEDEQSGVWEDSQ